jgi:membrane-bound lytic murein transglycosylase A
MGGAGYAGTVGDWVDACNGLSAAPNARGYFEKNFSPFAVSASPGSEGLFTGYYEPELRASRTRHGIYQTPVYGLPPDLINVDLGAFRAA